MARSGAGVGVVSTIVVLSILSLGLFISTVVFFGKYNRASGDLANADREKRRFVTAAEEQDAQLQAFLQAAERQAPSASLVGYLNNALQQSMAATTGSRRDDFNRLMQRLGEAQLRGFAIAKGWEPPQDGSQGNPPTLAQLAEGTSLLQLMRDMDAAFLSTRQTLAESERARARADNDLRSEVDRVRGIEARHRDTLADLQRQIGAYEEEVDSFRNDTNNAQALMNQRLDTQRSEAADRESTLANRITELEEENARISNQLESQRQDRQGSLRGTDEYALVDGTILAVNAGARRATISIGREQKVVIGMPFAVYTNASAIRPDAQGNYPRGKAQLEVIEIANETATCRITSQTQGNPIVRGDVIANAVYDPNKVYTMLVFGNFDANRDGVATEGEQRDWEAAIEGWGGRVVDEMTGHIDFLVLGQRPVLPPEPPVGASYVLVQEYLRQEEIVRRYDELFRQAAATAIPVLNENRLRTLIGGF